MDIRIYAKTISGAVVTINCYPSYSIANLKEEIIAVGFPSKGLELMTETWDKLQNEKLVSDYNFCNNTTLHILYGVDSSMKIFVQSAKGTATVLNVDPLDTVESVRRQLRKKRMLVGDQSLMFKGLILMNVETLANSDIKNDSVLHVVRYVKPTVQTLTGQTIRLFCKEQATISQLIDQLHTMHGIPLKGVRLVTDDWTQLDKGKKLSEYNITSESNLRVVHCITDMQIYIKTMSGETHDLDVKLTDTIRVIKAKIAAVGSIASENTSLVTDDWVLVDDYNSTLSDYNITNETTLHLVQGDNLGLKIRVILNIGGREPIKMIALDVLRSDTIGTIKAKIEAKEGIPTDNQSLFFPGFDMKENVPLSKANIPNNSTANLKLLPIEITVKIMTGKAIRFYESASRSIAYLKGKLNAMQSVSNVRVEKSNRPVKNFKLSFEGKELDNKSSLAENNIYKPCTLDIVSIEFDESPSPTYDIFVKLFGIHTKVKVKASDSIEMLKAKIQESEDIHPDKMRLLFDDTNLEDGRTLMDYSIHNRCIVNLYITQCGC